MADDLDPMQPKRRLRKLHVDRVDLVGAGANPGAHVLVAKKKDPAPVVDWAAGMEAIWLSKNPEFAAALDAARVRASVLGLRLDEKALQVNAMVLVGLARAGSKLTREEVDGVLTDSGYATKRLDQLSNERGQRMGGKITKADVERAQYHRITIGPHGEKGISKRADYDIESRTTELRKSGLPEHQARVQAAREAVAVRSAQLADIREFQKAPTPVTKSGSLIRAHRIMKGLTQVQLASEARLSERTLARYEAGDFAPSGADFWNLVNALGLSRDEVHELGRECR